MIDKEPWRCRAPWQWKSLAALVVGFFDRSCAVETHSHQFAGLQFFGSLAHQKRHIHTRGTKKQHVDEEVFHLIQASKGPQAHYVFF